MATKKKKYYKPSGDGIAIPVRGYLVKSLQESSSLIEKNDGPFTDESEAIELLRQYLKSGICSWVVNYYD